MYSVHATRTLCTRQEKGLLRVSDRVKKRTFIIFTQKVQKNFIIWLILYSLTSDDVPVQRKRGFAFSYGGGLKFNDPEVAGLMQKPLVVISA